MVSVVSVTIYSEINEFPTEKRYDPNIKISELKKKLELITGANHTSMTIFLSIDGKEIGKLDNNDETLAHYLGENPSQSPTIKLVVKDEQPVDLLNGDVPKYTISDEKYEARKDNVRNFIKETRQKQMSGQ